MKKKSPFASIVFLLILLVGLWDACEDTIEYLFIRTPPSLMKLRMLWVRNPQGLIYSGLFLLLTVILIVTVFSMPGRRGSVSTDTPSHARRTGTPRTSVSPEISPRIRGTQTRNRAGGRKFSEKRDPDEAIHCDHRSGREKYLEQIDNYLKTGLIDRNEYKVLRDRYMKIDIPNDYH